MATLKNKKKNCIYFFIGPFLSRSYFLPWLLLVELILVGLCGSCLILTIHVESLTQYEDIWRWGRWEVQRGYDRGCLTLPSVSFWQVTCSLPPSTLTGEQPCQKTACASPERKVKKVPPRTWGSRHLGPRHPASKTASNAFPLLQPLVRRDFVLAARAGLHKVLSLLLFLNHCFRSPGGCLHQCCLT